MPATPFDDVVAAVLAAVRPLPATECAPAQALGLALADDVRAAEAVPPFANSAMDGYAVRAADTVGASADTPVVLVVVGELAAGHASAVTVGHGEAVRIMTGAPFPPGADAIVMVEETERDGDTHVRVHRAAAPGDFVRAAGGDVAAGQLVFPSGTRLGPAQVGVLVATGLTTVPVIPAPRVGVVSTGDELVEAGPLAPGLIRDANRPMLLGLLARAGCVPVDLGIARDTPDAMHHALSAAIAACDAVITSGGVSVGDFDYVDSTLRELAAADPAAFVASYQVAIRPAKPFSFAVVHGTPVFGLPGNPVSSLVSFELFARPALATMAGHGRRFRPRVLARAAHALPRRPDGRLYLDRARVRVVDGRYVAESAGRQESNVLSAAAAAEGLMLIPDGDGLPEGADVEVLLLESEPDH